MGLDEVGLFGAKPKEEKKKMSFWKNAKWQYTTARKKG